MTRSDPTRNHDGLSRVWIQAALVVGALYWVQGQLTVSASDELAQAKAQHDELQTLRAERDHFSADNYALREQLREAHHSQELLTERLRLSRLSELQRPTPEPALELDEPLALVTVKTEPRPIANKVSPKTPLALLPSVKQTPKEPVVVAPVMLRSDTEDSRLGSEVELVSVDPGRVEFRGSKVGDSKLSLQDGEDHLESADLMPYHRKLARAQAEEIWLEARQETADEECGKHRGPARSRCEAEVAQQLSPYGPLAVQCIMSGNAQPDYVWGVELGALPSDAVPLEKGALILCDADLRNR